MVDFFSNLQGGFAVGDALGGSVGAGLADRRQAQLQERELGLQRQKLASDQQQQFRKELGEDIKTLTDIVTASSEKGSASVGRVLSNPGFQKQVQLLSARAQAGGIDLPAENMMTRFEAIAAGAETAEDRQSRQIEEAQGEAAGAVAQLDILSQLPEDQQEALRQRLGFATTRQTSEFLNLLDEAERLQAAGQEGSSRHNFVTDRLQRLSTETAGPQFSLQIDEDGRVRGVSFGDESTGGVVSELTGAQAFKQDQRISGIDQSITKIDSILADLETDPEDFGAIGSLRGNLQGTIGVMSDMSELISNSTGGIVDLNAVAGMISEAFDNPNLFDENLPRLDAVERDLAISLANLRFQRQGSEMRSSVAVIQQAREDVQLKGLTSSAAVRARMQEVRSIFEQEREGILRGLRGSADEMTDDDIGSMSLDEIDRQIEALQGGGGG